MKSFPQRAFLNTAYSVLYLIKMKNLKDFRSALTRAKEVKAKVTRQPYSFMQIVRFFLKRYLNI